MTESESLTLQSSLYYYQDDLIHETDFALPLHHGILRYTPAPYLGVEVKNSFPVKNDRKYVFVPAGYVAREKECFVRNILNALGLELPSLVVVTTGTEGGSLEEQLLDKSVLDKEVLVSSSAALSLPESELKNVLCCKVQQMLDNVVDCCKDMGNVWIMPDDPRRRNSVAQIICAEAPIAMGIIGLDDDDEEEGFKDCILASMQPVGSPINKVSTIPHDPDVRDGAPCFELTHLLIFESPHEMDVFKHALLAVVPELLCGLGNITDASMQRIHKYAVDGNPIILFRHTGHKINNLCKMFLHVEKEMEIPMLNDDDIDHKSTTAVRTRPELSDATIKIPPMIGMEDELINFFVSTWPANFQSETVALVDPIECSNPQFQTVLSQAISVSFNLQANSNRALQKARKRVLDYAWSFHTVTQRHSLEKKNVAESLHIQLVTCTLFSIVISVMYDRIYGDNNNPKKTPFQLLTFVFTILLPLYITLLQGERYSSTKSPTNRWSVFKVATAKLESEIFKLRAQVGPYRPLDKSQEQMHKPMTNFVEQTRVIWSKIKTYLKGDGMEIPDTFSQCSAGLSPDGEEKEAKTSDEETPAVNETTPILLQNNHYGELFMPEGLENIYEPADGGWERMGSVVSSVDPMEGDDQYSLITAEQYLNWRVEKAMRIKSKELAQITSRNHLVRNIIQATTICSGAVAALSLQWTIPIILGLTAVVVSAQQFHSYSKRIELINVMITQLNDLELWWMSLSMYQQQLPHNKERLVLDAENVIVSESMGKLDVWSSL